MRHQAGDSITKTDPTDLLELLESFTLCEDMDRDEASADLRRTRVDYIEVDGSRYPRFTNEFWTSRQRQASTLHEVSYRACFKPQLPRFFIKLLTNPEDTVYDPFSGRGTTAVEAGLLGRRVIANDVNPLSRILCRPRLHLPELAEVRDRLYSIPYLEGATADLDLSMFYHRTTESELVSLRRYLLDRHQSEQEDSIDSWIRMVATNRLTGHSKGFFSVYTLPPNQAVSQSRQIAINQRLKQTPEYRDTRALIIRKSKQMLSGVTDEQRLRLRKISESALFLTCDARYTPAIPDQSVKLTVTSPPFLDVVQYADDNWLRCWFNGIDTGSVASKISMCRSVEEWSSVMGEVFRELHRITAPGGYVAFEVGEVKRGKVRLDEHVIPLGLGAGFDCIAVVVNSQAFTKTANIWGVTNNSIGTNTNRIVIFRRPVSGAQDA